MKPVFIIFILLAFMVPQSGSYRLEVNITGINPQKGEMYLSLHNKPKYFQVPDSAFRKVIIKIRSESETAVFKNLPAGKYALAIFHDMNDNAVLDATEIGIPTEGYAFSGKKKGPGRPHFEESSFELEADTTIGIKMLYHPLPAQNKPE